MKFQPLLRKFKWRFLLTLVLILAEAGLSILFPLFIGWAIDNALQHTYTGAVLLASLGVLVLIIGMSRRVYDSRLYARIFEELGVQIIGGKISDQAVSKQTAHLHMLKEMVEFLENDLPELIQEIIGLAGVVIILAFLNTKIFVGGLIALLLVFIVYVLSSEKTVAFNKAYNNELETQVDVVTTQKTAYLNGHLQRLMHWNIKLSDLEALNFSLSWLVLMGFLVVSIVFAVQDGVTQYGALLALVMYVFQLIENIVVLPLYYQHWLRLQEIAQRIENDS